MYAGFQKQSNLNFGENWILKLKFVHIVYVENALVHDLIHILQKRILFIAAFLQLRNGIMLFVIYESRDIDIYA